MMRQTNIETWLAHSRVTACARRRIAGAAKITIGNIRSQETSQDCNQCMAKDPVTLKGKLAMAAAIADVRPD
jgi:hypothetical protein